MGANVLSNQMMFLIYGGGSQEDHLLNIYIFLKKKNFNHSGSFETKVRDVALVLYF